MGMSYAETESQPAIAGMQLDPQSPRDENGHRTSYVVITDVRGHVLGTIGQVKRCGDGQYPYYARPAEGMLWRGNYRTAVDAAAHAMLAFMATQFATRAEKIVREYQRGLLTRAERDRDMANVFAEYSIFAQAGIIPCNE